MSYLLYYLLTTIKNTFNFLLNIFYYLRFYFKVLFNYFNKDFINNINKDGWTLTFNDEFDNNEIDFDKKWNKYFSENTDSSPSEKNFCFSLDCIDIQDNKLHLYTKKNDKYPNESNFPYKTGNLDSCPWQDKYFDQQYGYFEIRCKVPPGGGKFWPAFWLLGDTWPPEIDIIEFMDNRDANTNHSKRVSMTHHFGTPGKKGMNTLFQPTQLSKKLGKFLGLSVNFDEHFHLFAVKWEYNYIKWYIDNVPVYKTIYNIPNNKMRVIVSNGSSMVTPPTSNELPQDFIIDYIRVYMKNEYL